MPAASIMVVRHLVMLAAFLMQPNLPAGTLWPENRVLPLEVPALGQVEPDHILAQQRSVHRKD
jgi:hypothetical protein